MSNPNPYTRPLRLALLVGGMAFAGVATAETAAPADNANPAPAAEASEGAAPAAGAASTAPAGAGSTAATGSADATPMAEAAEGENGIFATGVLDGLSVGDTLAYSHRREVEPEDEALPPIDGGATVAIEEADTGRSARVTLTEDDQVRANPTFPADAGHPLLLIFLENAVRNMAAVTGGSPFYIRNRMREALWEGTDGTATEVTYDGVTVSGEKIVYRPFADDPRRADMGSFADLELRFIVSDDIPGRIAVMDMETAEAGTTPYVRETITLEGIETEETQ